MESKSVPVQQMLLRQMISEAGIVKREHKEGLKKYFEKKFAQHVNIMQYHRMREDRFIQSQKRVLEKQNYSIRKAKQHIQLRQDKATLNKAHSIIERSKRIECQLSRWEQTVQKNKKEERQRLQNSTQLISLWNDKLSESSSRKSTRMNNLSHMLHNKTALKKENAEHSRQQQEQQRIRHLQNPERKTSKDSRYNSRQTQRHSRISTESLFDRRTKIEENILERSIIKGSQKQEKINQARYMKHHMMERKNKLKHDKEEEQRARRQQHLKMLKESIEARNQQLDRKFNKETHGRPKRISLPLVSAHQASNEFFLKSPGEQWRDPKGSKGGNKKVQEPTSRTMQPNYSKLVMQKIHDIAHIMRRNRV